MPPEFREYLSTYVGGAVGIALGFVFMLVAGAVFSTIGGAVGAVLFRRPAEPDAGLPPDGS